MIQKKRCYGCGAYLQSDDIHQIGYVPSSALQNEKILCQRCFRINHYHQLTKTNLTKDDFLNIMQTIAEKNCLIIYMIDIYDFNGSMISGIQRHLLGNDMIVVANKRDILPKSIKDNKIKEWLRFQLKEYGIQQPLDILLVSAKKNYCLDELINAIYSNKKDRDVYVIGATNVGKSSLINALLKHYSQSTDYLITTSEFPGTTLDLIEIPFDEHHSLYDTPGIINDFQMAHFLDEKDMKTITPKNELKPKSYQLNAKQTLYFGGLARLDFIDGDASSFICYFPSSFMIHRTKLENADQLYNKGMTLKPVITSIQNIEAMTSHTFILTDHKKTDIVISGLGWITVKATNQKIIIKAPKGVGVMLRRALI